MGKTSMTVSDNRQRLVDSALKGLCTLASVVFYGNSRNADWIYEKMNRPSTYVYEAMNVINYMGGRPKVHRIVSLIVEPVFGCNLSCSYCWDSITRYFDYKSKRPHFMPMDLFKKLVDQAPESVESIAFALIGEPLLHPEIHAMIRYAGKSGLRTVLYTNGTLLSGQTLQNIVSSGLDVLVVSVEPDSENTRKHRGVSLEAIKKNIQAFHAVKPGNLDIKLSVVVHEDNVRFLDKISKQWDGLVDHIKLSPLIRYNGTGLLGNCIEPWRGSLSILTSGEVSPCCISAGYKSIPIGNLQDNTLEDIIQGTVFRQLLTDFSHGRRPDVCCRCRTFKNKSIPSRIPSLSGSPSGRR
jgi:MoaA/NifB/PqqE/SkfB family radical SAM enzyme